VGWAATQLARSVGAVTIFGTCSPEKHDAVRENGVTHPLIYDGYEQELLKYSPGGVDIIIDNMSSSAFTTNQRLLKPLGRIVVTGETQTENWIQIIYTNY
jgi:NADPH:quinone reductase-like Zn-dependent oxidoreductase